MGHEVGEEEPRIRRRYLPKKARQKLSPAEYKRTSDRKRADLRKGKQFSKQPEDIARKTASARKTGTARRRGGPTKADLMAKARERNIGGRSKMSKAELERALAG
jgi:hypothetical protein